MSRVLSVAVPELAEAASVGWSREGDGLGLFARREFGEGDIVHRWSIDSRSVMRPLDALSDKLESEEFGALAFQVLKESRSKEPTPWRLWWAAGARAPETHPLKLVLSNPRLVQELWNSTTCGGRMSASALRLRDDLELLQGGATLEEWAEAVALVMSRCIVEDDGVPLLVMGLDLLQDGGEPNVEATAEYDDAGGPLGLGVLGGFGGNGERRLTGVALTARRPVQAGDELTGRYLEKPHAGRYLERYGFVPERLRGPLAAACVELSFAPTDEDDDFHFAVKESLLEDVGLSTDPLPFFLSTEEGFGPPSAGEGAWDWERKSTLDKMVHILRLRKTGGPESYLLDSVLVDKLWDNCNFRISKDNESAVCRAVIDECDRWLERFESLEDAQSEDDNIVAAAAADVRAAEADLLSQVRDVFAQELRDTIVDESRRYWVDRQLDEVFPQRKGRKGTTGVDFIDDP